VPQIESWASSQGILFSEGWKVDLARETKKRALARGIQKFDDSVVQRWTQLFKDFETLGSASV
jgi:hypothetical protein